MKKYILLLVSVFAFGQASNQMVTFTEAQSLGFTLKSGQSHVTSNQCMTKSEALAKYNIDASAMASYANNQLVPRSAWYSVTTSHQYYIAGWFSTRLEACTYEEDYMILYASTSVIQETTQFFLDANLTNPFDGRVGFYTTGLETFIINLDGTVSDIMSCQPTLYNHLVSSNSFNTPASGCYDISEEILKYSNDSILVVGSILYDDSGLTTVFNGNGKWWKITGNIMAYILNNGEVAVFSNGCN